MYEPSPHEEGCDCEWCMPLKDVIALAKVGVRAVIDEATGYQSKRPKDDLDKYFHRLH